ncbi:MAG: hypothetical protein NZ958_08295 [Bacteroidia bacterium]|nr:hypothetical protein [Bacteroidia bacterium]MDW8088518.1 hypothetical protein [Bacteroidia bacterium]
MKYWLRQVGGEWIIEGRRVHYVGGQLKAAWAEAFEAFGLVGRSWPKVLLIGMGASLVQILAATAKPPFPTIHIIESDPEMVALQERYLEFPLPYHLHLGLAEALLPTLKETFGGIFVDAFVEDSVPEPLQQEAFVAELARCLAPSGLLFWNVLRPKEATKIGTLLRRYFSALRLRRCGPHRFYGAAHHTENFPLPY